MSINNQQSSVYNQMIQWRDAHSNNMQEAQQNLDNAKTEDEQNQVLFDYENKKEEIGSNFNFMDGKDATDDKDYNEQLKTLGEGDLKLLDTDGDGKVSKTEYLAREVYDLGENATDEEKAETMAMAYLTYDIIDQQMGDKDSDGSLSADDLSRFYENMDKLNVDSDGVLDYGDNYKDGQFSVDDASEFIPFLIDNFSDKDQLDTLTSQFLKAIQENN